jgi:hypothetical protein
MHCYTIVIVISVRQETAFSDGKSHLPLEITRRAGMGDASHLLEENKFEVGKKESVVLVLLSRFIEFLPLCWSKCLTIFYVVVQFEEYTRGDISKPMLTIESTEHTLRQQNERPRQRS